LAYPLVKIGRAEENGLAIPSDLRLSRHHAQLAYLSDQWIVRDLTSTNGTFVNGNRLPAGGSFELRPGDVITCGAQSFRLNWVVPPPALRQILVAPPVVGIDPPRTATPSPEEPVLVISPVQSPPPIAATKIPPKVPATEIVRWVLPGQPVNIAGRTITVGLFYFGHSMKADNGYDIEPSLIDDLLEVRSKSNAETEVLPSYYVAYDNFSPEERARYLDWLADGRPPSKMVDSCGFLFLAGIERQYFSGAGDSSNGRAEAIAELRRLADAAPPDSKAATLIRRFLFASGCDPIPSGSEPLDASLLNELTDGFLPDSLRLRLAVRVASGASLTPLEAFLAVASDDETYTRTPFYRCTDEVLAVFSTAYSRKYPQGVSPKCTKEQFEFRYRPANHSMFELRMPQVNVCDFRIAPQTLIKLRSFLAEATDALDAYSRRLASRESERGFLPAISLLPAELWHSHPTMHQVRRLADAASDRGNRFDLVELGPFWVGWPENRPLSRLERETVAKALCQVGYASEPHWTVSATIEPTDSVFICQLGKGTSCECSPRFGIARQYVRFLCHTASMLQVVGPDVPGRIAGWAADREELDPSERSRATLFALWCFGRSDQKLSNKEQGSIPREAHQSLFEMVVEIMATTRDLSPANVKEVIRIAKTLGIAENDVYSLIHRAQSSLVPQRRERKPSGGLDMDLVALKVASSQTACAILQTVFTDDEEIPMNPVSRLPLEESELPVLPRSIEELVHTVLGRTSWTATEFSVLAKDFGMLPGAAYDRINEHSLDAVGELLLYGEEAIVIDADVAVQLQG
jgi:pSer/pThr/pTyr-binding forkhead associated (FHA) protein